MLASDAQHADTVRGLRVHGKPWAESHNDWIET